MIPIAGLSAVIDIGDVIMMSLCHYLLMMHHGVPDTITGARDCRFLILM